MTDDQLDDLKQFFAATIGQTENRLGARIDAIEVRMSNLEEKVDSGFAGIAEIFEQHDARITALEQKTARITG